MYKLFKICLLFACTLPFIQCDDESPQFQSNDPAFSLDLFEQNLSDRINNSSAPPIGWAYTISKDGQLARQAAFGLARTQADKQLAFSTNKEINVASVSKFYTAIAAMQLLAENNLDINDNIATWLPNSWAKGPGVNNLTFADLLGHRSGLQSMNSDFSNTLSYDGIEQCIATGVVNSTNYNYLNVNFALFRILIPSLWSALPGSPAINIEVDANTQFMYLLYMQENIFDRLNLPLVGCFPEARSECTLYYNTNDDTNGANGAYYGDWNPICGGGGYFMTAIEMAKVNAFFEHTEELVTEAQRDIMKANRFGMDLEDSGDEIHGSYYGKGGSISNGSNQGVRTQIVMFPINGVDCAVVMNSQGVVFPNTTSLRQMIYDAYNDAWE